jgi:hypothetical protein
MIDDDEDELTIDHLIGVTCVLNSSVEVEVRRNTKKGRLELCEGDRGFFVVDKVSDVAKDGSYIVTLLKTNGSFVTDTAQLIKKSLVRK